MSNFFALIDELELNKNALTNKKQQTDYKIKYVSEYIKQWAIISSMREEITDITFIDCMCNAGIYSDGDLCTATEVLLIFTEVAQKHPDKKYNLYLNDYDTNKLKVLNTVIEKLKDKAIQNIRIYIDSIDVNDYLKQLNLKTDVFGYGKSVVLYIDPYDFGTVHIPEVHEILKNHYCELIFNFFISDYVRNWNNNRARIKVCLGGTSVETKEELIDYINAQFKTGHIKHSFSYQFKTVTNVELYQIMFFTPSKRGIEVLKDTLWKVFNGEFFHRNKRETLNNQLSLISEEDEKQWLLERHSQEAKDLLMKCNGAILKYTDIEILLIEKSMLKEGQILKHVIKPLIAEGKIIKLNEVSSVRNFKDDSYKVGDL